MSQKSWLRSQKKIVRALSMYKLNPVAEAQRMCADIFVGVCIVLCIRVDTVFPRCQSL